MSSVNSHIGENSFFDIYKVLNSVRGESEFPADVAGAVGVTFDKHINGIVHNIVNFSAFISCFVHEIEESTDQIGTNLLTASHAFIALGKDNATALKVGEAAGPGVIRNTISMGDSDWTSMILFLPKNEKVRKNVIRNMNLELLPPSSMKKTAQYPAISGFFSSFKNLNESCLISNKRRLAWALTDFIQNRSIRDSSNCPKEGICSSVALRVLQSSMMMSVIGDSKLEKYSKLERKQLCHKLLEKMQTPNHPLNSQLKSINFLNVNSGITLPYQLYQLLISESEIENLNLIDLKLIEFSNEELEHSIELFKTNKEEMLVRRASAILNARQSSGH